MKKLLLLLLVISFSYGQTRTATFRLPQWSTGDTLKAGTANDSSLSNFALNNGFSRLDLILGKRIDSSGNFKSIGSTGTGNFSINVGLGSATPVQVVFSDSIYSYYNIYTEGSLLTEGNIYAGGYVTSDSVIVTGATGLIMNAPSGSARMLFQVASANKFLLGTGSGGSLLTITPYGQGNGSVVSATNLGGLEVGGTITADTLIGAIVAKDSIQSTTIHTVLFNSEKIASATLNDTSANFTEWSVDDAVERPIVRLKYLHKAGIQNVVARYYAKNADADDYFARLSVGSVSTTTQAANASYTLKTTTVSVAGLTANTLYDLTFKIKDVTGGGASSYFKELVITAESN